MPAGKAEFCPVGIGVAGLGAIGLLHSRHLAQIPGARLAAVVDSDAQLAEGVGRELCVPWGTSFERVLEEPAIEAVVIATPTPLHAAMVAQAAAARKHVFCEKPLSLDVFSGRSAVNAAAVAEVALQVGFQRRFDPDFLTAKACVDAGELGDVKLLRISHRNRVPPHGGELSDRLGGPFVDMTIHDFDSARWLVGEVRAVTAFEGDGASAVVAQFDCGALALIDNTRGAGYGFECAVELMGDRSTLRFGADGHARGVERLTAGARVLPIPADNVERHRAAYLDELRHFVACVRDGTTPVVGGEDSLAALELSLAAERCVA